MKTTARLALCASLICPVSAAETVFDFTDPADRLTATAGSGALTYYDQGSTGWGPAQTAFGTASSFGIVPVPGGDKVVMQFPACTPAQGYMLTTGLAPNGFFSGGGMTSNYTVVLDVLFPDEAGSDRALLQTNPANTDDADLVIRKGLYGGVGISRRYDGSVLPGAWHRIVCVVRAAADTGRMEKYIDGVFAGAQGLTGSAIDLRFAAGPEMLLFTDDNVSTTRGYCSSIRIVDRCLTLAEVTALGSVSSGGARVAGLAAPDLAGQIQRPLRIIGNRGASGSAPENTIAAIQRAYADGAFAVKLGVRLTADFIPVIINDATVNRTTNGTGDVASLTLEHIKTLDAGAWFSPEFAGQTVPTVEEVMAAVPPGRILYLEPKLPGLGAYIAAAAANATFPQERLWLGAGTNTTEAIALKSAVSGASITFAVTPYGIEPDATTQSQLQALGVVLLEADAESGVVDEYLAARLQELGWLTAASPLMTPAAFHAAARSGLHAAVTDYPAVLATMQPPVIARASLPDPADGAPSARRVLAWNPGAAATAHRIHFGTTNPPPFLREQSPNVCTIPQPEHGVTYYWRIDEVTTSGTVAGDVWTFTGTSTAVANRYEWNFVNGELHRVRGTGELTWRDTASRDASTYEITDGTTVPHPDGTPAPFLRVPALSSSGGLLATFSASPANGGGSNINRFAIIMDVLSPGPAGWAALFNGSVTNANDADWYINPSGALGIGALGYAANGTIAQNTWYRLAFSADASTGVFKYFVNGTLVRTRTGTTMIDGRFSPGSNVLSAPDLLFFVEGNTTGDNTHELLVANIAFADNLLLDDEIIRLGGPKTAGIFGPSGALNFTATALDAAGLRLTWPAESGVLLQYSPTLQPYSWTSLPVTNSTGSYSTPADNPRAFFRLFRP